MVLVEVEDVHGSHHKGAPGVWCRDQRIQSWSSSRRLMGLVAKGLWVLLANLVEGPGTKSRRFMVLLAKLIEGVHGSCRSGLWVL